MNLIFIITDSSFGNGGELLTISDVETQDENIIYKCSLATPERPGIDLHLRVHPPYWSQTTSKARLQIQNLPSTRTSHNGSATFGVTEKISIFTIVAHLLLAYTLRFALPFRH